MPAVASPSVPWLSVIVPSHNGERWLATMLGSLAVQNDPGIEVILMDSSDSDASLAIAEGFVGDLRLTVHRRPDVKSWQAKTNLGAAGAAADWLCMLHQDDMWHPGRAAAVRGWLDRAGDVVLHLHAAALIDAPGNRRGIWRCPLPAEQPMAEQEILARLLVQNFICIATPVIRRDTFLGVGGLDETLWYTADWDLYLKLIGRGHTLYHSEPLAAFRIHEQSLTMTGSRSLEAFREQMNIVVERHLPRLVQGRERVHRISRASVAVNLALAAAMAGHPRLLLSAAAGLFALGPRGWLTYFENARLLERTYPRLRAHLAGTL